MSHPLVEDWLVRFGDETAYEYLVTDPQPPRNQSQNEYDGIYCCWLMSNLMATRNPSLSTLLFENSEALMQLRWDVGMDTGPADQPLYQPSGYDNYNKGPRRMADDARTNPALVNDYLTIAANYARASAYARPIRTVSCRAAPDCEWPNTGLVNDPTPSGGLCREYALGVLSHLIVDDIYSDHESRDTNYGSPAWTFVDAHDFYIPEVTSRWFLNFDSLDGTDRELPYRGLLDTWRDIDATMTANNGDWTLDSRSYTGYSWRPFMMAHVCRMLIHAYSHSTITGHTYAAKFQAEIISAVSDICDMCLRWWEKPTAQGSRALMYLVDSEGVPPAYGDKDLALFEMPMFAWSYKMTGEKTHYDLAMALARTGIDEAYVRWEKHWNQCVIWAYEGFEWLGLLDADRVRLIN